MLAMEEMTTPALQRPGLPYGASVRFVVAGESVERDPTGELTPQIRAAKVALALARNRNGLRTRDVAQLCRLSMDGALKLLKRLSGSEGLPIYQDEHDVWRLCEVSDPS